MELPFPSARMRHRVRPALAWVPTAALGALLWASVAAGLWLVWRNDPAVSHGPLMVALALGHLWARRRQLGVWRSAAAPGLALLATACLIYVAAAWADIVFVKSLSLIAVTAGAIWFLAGAAALR